MERKIFKVHRTVPYDPAKSGEGLLIGKDGEVIYDDSWMHPEVFEEDAKIDNAPEQFSEEHMPNINGIVEIIDAWSKAKKVVVFTGAGMSTESGLPDFRSEQGLWKNRPEILATITALSTQPDEFYFFYQWRIAKLWGVDPNIGHSILASMQRQGLINALITQNVDGLHQRAGSADVLELHGSLRTVSCMGCGSNFESTILIPKDEAWEEKYKAGVFHFGEECQCPKCKGYLRPNVVLFGEQLPQSEWKAAADASRNADLFVVLGSSLTVSPANICPQLALEHGAKLLIVNHEATPLDDQATWLIREDIVDVLKSIASSLGQK